MTLEMWGILQLAEGPDKGKLRNRFREDGPVLFWSERDAETYCVSGCGKPVPVHISVEGR